MTVAAVNSSRLRTALWGAFLVLAACGITQTQPPRAGLASADLLAAREVPGQRRHDADARRQGEIHDHLRDRWSCERANRLQPRERGTWKSSGPNQLQFGPLALTRAMCPPGSLHDRIAKHWEFVRSYVIKDGHLFLSLMADGGIYEFEPMGGSKPAAIKVTGRVQGSGHITSARRPEAATTR